MCQFKSFTVGCMVLLCVVLTGSVAFAQTLFGTVSVDHRGLLDLGNGQNTNLIVFGPGWKYAAQDYALKNIKKTGEKGNFRFESDFQIPGMSVRFIQTVSVIKDQQGTQRAKVSCTLQRDQPFTLENAYVAIRVPVDAFITGKVTADDMAYDFPQTLDKEFLPFARSASSIVFTSELGMVDIQCEKLSLVRVDMRKHKSQTFEVRLMFPNVKNTTSSNVTFTVTAREKPYIVTADDKWIALPMTQDVLPGSMLDFSFMTNAPAGKFGRIIPNNQGHFVYENKPDTRIKLIGTNLCFGANYMPKPDVDTLALRLKRMGYNAIRFHHTDVDLIQGNWNAKQSDDIDPDQLDKLDYLMASMKNAGMVYAIDLFTMRRFGADEIPGWDEYVDNPNVIKALVPIMPSAFDAWSKLALKWLNHVNPYTHMAIKDDPALLSICPVNEDTITSVWQANSRTKQLYLDRFAQWKSQQNLTGDDKQQFAQFLTELRMAANAKLAIFFKDNDIPTMITGSNWWVTQAQTFTRNQFDHVDNHEYWDHPSPHYLPSRYNQRSDIRESISYVMPCFMSPTRIFGKPFTVTEYNFCAPNQYRAEGGAMMGAYSALQDWDGLFRFAWAHSGKNASEIQAISGFDIATDPISLLTERQIVLLFARGDVSPATKRYVYGVTMQEATKNGTGDMWSRGLFPRDFTKYGLVNQIGSQPVTDSQGIIGTFDAVVSESAIPAQSLAGNTLVKPNALPNISNDAGEIISDTHELTLHNKRGYVKVVTRHSECIVSPASIDLAGNCLSVSQSDTFSSISASSMDDNPLVDSKRVLFFHLTNVLNTDMQFRNATMTTLEKRGDLPHLVQVGSANVQLKNSNAHLKLFVLDFSGKPVRSVPTQYVDGTYHFTMSIAPGDEQPAMIYALTTD